jgi:hypothetical protein
MTMMKTHKSAGFSFTSA